MQKRRSSLQPKHESTAFKPEHKTNLYFNYKKDATFQRDSSMPKTLPKLHNSQTSDSIDVVRSSIQTSANLNITGNKAK